MAIGFKYFENIQFQMIYVSRIDKEELINISRNAKKKMMVWRMCDVEKGRW